MSLICSYRMYGVNDEVAALWAKLFDCVAQIAGVELQPFELSAPAPIAEIWSRDDMGLVQMCGWPFDRAQPQPIPLAAPVPADAFACGSPVYWSDMVVASDSPFYSLEDTFGHRIAWTTPGSHSGFNAPRRLLLDYFIARGEPLYTESVGPVITPRGAIEAVLDARADVAPVDGLFHLLLQRHEAEYAAQIRTVARTPKAPIPLCVASAGIDSAIVTSLRSALLSVHEHANTRALLTELCTSRFVAVDKSDYGIGEIWAEQARAAGYDSLW